LGINSIPKTLFPYYSYDLLLGEEDLGKNENNGDQMDPVRVTLSVEKNTDGKMGKTQVYFDYPRSRVLTQEEYQKEQGGIMEI
jgi:hypothetical protein